MLMNMDTLRLQMLLVHCFVLLKLCSCASMDRNESIKPRTTVTNFIHPQKDTEHQLDTKSSLYEDEYEDNYISGDYELTLSRAALSTNPKHPSVMPNTENKRKNRSKDKGKGRRRNPCLHEYKHFCIHGVCHYLKELKTHTCVCEAGYSGERCHTFTLAVAKEEQRYSRKMALAVTPVVLSLMCLTIIGMLLALRYHKKKAADEEIEIEVKPEATSGQS